MKSNFTPCSPVAHPNILVIQVGDGGGSFAATQNSEHDIVFAVRTHTQTRQQQQHDSGTGGNGRSRSIAFVRQVAAGLVGTKVRNLVRHKCGRVVECTVGVLQSHTAQRSFVGIIVCSVSSFS